MNQGKITIDQALEKMLKQARLPAFHGDSHISSMAAYRELVELLPVLTRQVFSGAPALAIAETSARMLRLQAIMAANIQERDDFVTSEHYQKALEAYRSDKAFSQGEEEVIHAG